MLSREFWESDVPSLYIACCWLTDRWGILFYFRLPPCESALSCINFSRDSSLVLQTAFPFSIHFKSLMISARPDLCLGLGCNILINSSLSSEFSVNGLNLVNFFVNNFPSMSKNLFPTTKPSGDMSSMRRPYIISLDLKFLKILSSVFKRIYRKACPRCNTSIFSPSSDSLLYFSGASRSSN